jgi:hypothetical protein
MKVAEAVKIKNLAVAKGHQPIPRRDNKGKGQKGGGPW